MNDFNHQYWTQWIRTRSQTLQGEWKHPRGMVWGLSVMSRVMIFPGWVWLTYIYIVYSKYIFIYIYGISTSFIIWVQYGSMFQWAQGSMSLRKSAIDSIFGAHSSTQLAEAGVERFWHDNMCLMYLRFTFCSNLSSKLTDLRGPSIRKALLSRRKLRGLGLWVKGCMTDDSNLKNDP